MPPETPPHPTDLALFEPRTRPLAELLASALVNRFQGQWPEDPGDLIRLLQDRLRSSPGQYALGLAGDAPPRGQEATLVREVLAAERSVEAAAVRLGWHPDAVRLAIRRHHLAWPPPCPALGPGSPCCHKGRYHEAGCDHGPPPEPETPDAEDLADERLDTDVGETNTGLGHEDDEPDPTQHEALQGAPPTAERPILGFSTDLSAQVAEGVKLVRPVPLPRRFLGQPAGSAAGPAEWLAQVRAAMEALRPGVTRDRPGPRPVRGAPTPPVPVGFEYDAGSGRIGYVSLAGDGRGSLQLVEGSWLPAEGAISDSCGAVPPGEAPAATAERLLGRPGPLSVELEGDDG